MKRQGTFQPHQQIGGIKENKLPAVFRQGKFQPHQQILAADAEPVVVEPVKKVTPIVAPAVEEVVEEVVEVVEETVAEATVEKKTVKTSKKN